MYLTPLPPQTPGSPTGTFTAGKDLGRDIVFISGRAGWSNKMSDKQIKIHLHQWVDTEFEVREILPQSI